MSYSLIRQRLEAGHYKVTGLEIVKQPTMHPNLRKTASMMTGPELKELPKLREEYDAEMKRSRENSQLWREAEGKKEAEFETDCAAAFDLTNNPTARGKVWSKAWEHGHSSGLHEVLYWYDEFATFLKEATAPAAIIP
jgi:hypothetical protein